MHATHGNSTHSTHVALYFNSHTFGISYQDTISHTRSYTIDYPSKTHLSRLSLNKYFYPSFIVSLILKPPTSFFTLTTLTTLSYIKLLLNTIFPFLSPLLLFLFNILQLKLPWAKTLKPGNFNFTPYSKIPSSPIIYLCLL
jgi:hypothetical protein